MHSQEEAIKKQQVCLASFDEVVDFYNEHESLFLDFKEEFGVDLWFLNHFRVYMAYRNHRLAQEFGEHTGSISKTSIHTMLTRLILELVYSLLSSFGKKIKSTESDFLIISKKLEFDGKRHKKFDQLDIDYEVLFNRNLFDLKLKVNKTDFFNGHRFSSDKVFINYLFSRAFLRDLYRFNKGIKKLKKELSKTCQTAKSGQDINTIFWKSKTNYINYVRYKSFLRFFQKSKLKGILVSDENSPQQKAIQYAAHQNSIKVFAFQHGNIHELHPAYIYGRYRNKPLLPDKTFTYGTYFTDFLLQSGGYSEDQVKDVGVIVPQVTSSLLSPKIDVGENILLFASQPQRDEKMRFIHLKDVLTAAKKNRNNYTLVIRPHPRETEDTFFNDVATEVNFHDFIIDRASSLDAHMKACKLLIVAFSTVGTEFVQYYKPMLVLDYLHQDLMKWIARGVGIPVYNGEELNDKLSAPLPSIDHGVSNDFINKYYRTDSDILNKIKEHIYDTI